MNGLTKLTDSQRDFADKNHHLVLQYLKTKGLDESDYYDIAVFGYLRAVQVYDQRPELQNHSFRTIANKRMYAAILNHSRSLRAAKRCAEVISLNCISSDGMELIEQISSHGLSVVEYAEAREKWESIQAAATPEQARMLKMRAQGYRNQEIGQVYYLTPSAVSGRICRLRKKTERLAA